MKKSPLQLVQDKFESKDALVKAVEALATGDLWIDRLNAVKGFSSISNSKLIRLHSHLSRAKSEFGSRAKLIAAILDVEKRAKDAGYQARLEEYPLPRLLDLLDSATRASKKAAKSPAAPAAKKLHRSKKAQAKAKA